MARLLEFVFYLLIKTPATCVSPAFASGCEIYYWPIGGSVADAGWASLTWIVFVSDETK
jgi:hypothetical protein